MGMGLARIGTGALVAVLAGCVTAPKTGQENIAASESPLLFAHPDGLSMQARHFRRFDPRNTGANIYRGNWRPSGGGQRPFFCAPCRRCPTAGANPARQLSLQPVAIGAGDGGNDMA